MTNFGCNAHYFNFLLLNLCKADLNPELIEKLHSSKSNASPHASNRQTANFLFVHEIFCTCALAHCMRTLANNRSKFSEAIIFAATCYFFKSRLKRQYSSNYLHFPSEFALFIARNKHDKLYFL